MALCALSLSLSHSSKSALNVGHACKHVHYTALEERKKHERGTEEGRITAAMKQQSIIIDFNYITRSTEQSTQQQQQ